MKIVKSLLNAIIPLVVVTTTMAQVPNYVPINGLVAWWGLNGNANDESGNGLNGTVSNVTLTIDRFGNANSAYSFDGISSKITGPNSSLLNLSNNRSVSVWIKSINNTSTADHGIIGYNSTSNNGHNGYMLYLQSTGKLISLEDNYFGGPASWSGAVSNDNTFLSDNVWHNIISTRKNDSTKIYIDGRLQNVYTSLIPNFNNSSIIIGHTNFSNQYFKGSIDDIGIWNRSLNQQEINALYSGNNFAQISQDVPSNSLELRNANNNSGWIKKGVVKVEKQNASTGSWDEIMFTTPGKFIEIRNNKDIRISDLDVFSAVLGRDYMGIYNVAEFTDGKNQQTSVPQTVSYIGYMVLKQSNVPGTSAETGVFFYYLNGNMGAIEIRSKICMCASRIYIGEYQEGMRILKE